MTPARTAGVPFFYSTTVEVHLQKLIAMNSNFGNVFGNQFLNANGGDVAMFFRDQLFKQLAKNSATPAKVDAQFMALALATYFTSSNLAVRIGLDYGFNVTAEGIGVKQVNVGARGAAFGVADYSTLTIMHVCQKDDDFTAFVNRMWQAHEKMPMRLTAVCRMTA